ncbi:MAG: phytoene desaturase family protein [Chloroflexota bacterium]|nr:phytoene desaturase family protein [Chloroflexota bacterium]
MTETGKKVVVIGSGFGGLGTACLLSKEGYAVTLLEKNDQLGGRAGLLEDGVFRWDMGPSWYLMPDVFEAFFEALGERVEDHLQLERLSPGYRIFFEDGDVVDMTGNLSVDAATFDRYEVGAGEKLREYLRLSEYQYTIAMRDFVPKNYDSYRDFFTRQAIVEGPKLHVLESMDRYVGRFFTHPKLRKIIQYTLVFLGSSPYTTPALYNIMSHVDFNLGVWYPEGGIHEVIRVLARIAKQHGTEIRCSSAVNRILVDDGKVVGVQTADGIVEADIVVSNADLHHTETELLQPPDQSLKEKYWSKRTLAPSAFIIYLGLDTTIPHLAHHNLYFCEDWRTNFDSIFKQPSYPDNPSLYICCPSKTDASVAPSGHENLFVLVPVAPGLDDTPEIREQYANHILDLVVEKLAIPGMRQHIVSQHIFSINDFASRYNSYKGSALGLAHTLRQSAVWRPNNRSKKVRGLYYVGANTNPGIGMPMCLISAQLVRKRVLYGK